MMDAPPPGSSAVVERPPDDRLDSWKEIASYLKRDVTTVQRWEKREGMPVHRHLHDKMGSVYAFRTELDAWTLNRRPAPGADAAPAEVPQVEPATDPAAPLPKEDHRWALAAAVTLLASGFVAWQLWTRDAAPENQLADARFQQLTDFAGTEQAAALSRDGKLVAFLADREGRMDVWVSQIGTGQFYNLTRGAARELVNPSVRVLGFSPDGTLVTFWARSLDAASQSEISVWGVPVLGGPPRPYLEGVAEFDWTADGARLVYHTPGPGDPMFVRNAGEDGNGRRIFTAPPGLHSHFPLWSPDETFIYFVQGSVPDRMDIWRIGAAGGAPERITSHDSVVSHPVFVNDRTLMYLASDEDGAGPWIHSVDVDRRVSRRVSFGIDRYTSLAAAADGRRLVATLASPKGTLWRMTLPVDAAEASDAQRIPLTTGNGFAPRLGAGFLIYATSKGTSDSIWKLEGDAATELWSASEARIIGGPALEPRGRRLAFSSRQGGRTLLQVANDDGTNVRVVTSALELQGAPAWAPDGRSITVAASLDGVPRLFNVPLDGGQPAPMLEEYSLDPAWSPDGELIVFSGPDIGTTFPIKAVTADGRPYPVPDLMLTRGARRVSFIGDRRSLVVLRGAIGHKNLWLVDLDTGRESQLTSFAPGFDVRDFAISPNGREIVLEQVQEDSDIVLLDIPR